MRRPAWVKWPYVLWPSKRVPVLAETATIWGAGKLPDAPAPIVKTLSVKSILLGLESWITAIPFTVSWYVCAVYFAVKAGYLMAKADGADKGKVLDALWKKKR